ncbi:MAG: hypothetical protein IJX47_05585 [Clostridia bacterium]|nr:hypothetical protein [Clostridia bacterium]
MKKLSLLLAAMLVALSLTSCSTTDDPATESVSATNAPATTTAAPTTDDLTTEDPATTTKNPILDKVTTDAPVTEAPADTDAPDGTDAPDTSDTPDVPDTPDGFTVGTADELIAAIDAINRGDSPANTNIILTADIDMTGLAGVGDYEPLYRYSGTLDGAGHTIKNLNWTFIMKNGGGNMPNAEQVGSYVLEDLPDGTYNRYARGTVALLVLELDEGGVVKDLTLADSSLNIECSFNKNYQMYVGGVVGYLNGGTVEDVTLSDVDVTVPANVNYNQGFTGYAAPVAGRVSGDSAVTDCAVGSDCSVDVSANVMFNTGTLVGVLEADGTVTVDGSSSEAVCTVHPNPTTDVLAYKGDGITLGGVAGGLVGTELQ